MTPFAFLLLVTLFSGSESNPDEDRLRQVLLHSKNRTYNPHTTPIHNDSDSVDVLILLKLKKILDLDDVEEILRLQYYVHYEWNDFRLRWNPSEYGQIKHIHFMSSKVWTPQILVRNNAKQSHVHEVTPQSDFVKLHDDGSCDWSPRYELGATACAMDITWFPFDEQKCKLIFASWQLERDNIKLTPRMNQDNYIKSDEWILVEITANSSFFSDGEYPQVIFEMWLRRKPTYYVINIIIPCILISFIAAATFILPPNCMERLGLTVTIVLAITVYQLIVNDKLPTTSKTPVIIMFFFFSIGMSVCSVLLTMVVIRMELKAEIKPLRAMPRWTRYVFCKLFATWLCLKPPRSSVQPPQVYRKRESLATVDNYSNRPQRDDTKRSSMETTVESMNKLLVEIRDLLRTRAQREDNHLNDDETEEEIKMDWMLAAVVLNRICAVGFVVVFVVGTLTFILLIATHYQH